MMSNAGETVADTLTRLNAVVGDASIDARTEYERFADEIEGLADVIHDKADEPQLAGASADEIEQLQESVRLLERAVERLADAIQPTAESRH